MRNCARAQPLRYMESLRPRAMCHPKRADTDFQETRPAQSTCTGMYGNVRRRYQPWDVVHYVRNVRMGCVK